MVIDESHYNLDDAELLWRKLRNARDCANNTQQKCSDKVTLTQGATGDGRWVFSVTYKINGITLMGLSDVELRRVGLGLWLDYQGRFEDWQTTHTAGLSNRRPEDIPSTYLAYVDGVYDNLDYEMIVDIMGGTGPKSKIPPMKFNDSPYFFVGNGHYNATPVKYPNGLPYPNELWILPVWDFSAGYWEFFGEEEKVLPIFQ